MDDAAAASYRSARRCRTGSWGIGILAPSIRRHQQINGGIIASRTGIEQIHVAQKVNAMSYLVTTLAITTPYVKQDQNVRWSIIAEQSDYSLPCQEIRGTFSKMAPAYMTQRQESARQSG